MRLLTRSGSHPSLSYSHTHTRTPHPTPTPTHPYPLTIPHTHTLPHIHTRTHAHTHTHTHIHIHTRTHARTHAHTHLVMVYTGGGHSGPRGMAVGVCSSTCTCVDGRVVGGVCSSTCTCVDGRVVGGVLHWRASREESKTAPAIYCLLAMCQVCSTNKHTHALGLCQVQKHAHHQGSIWHRLLPSPPAFTSMPAARNSSSADARLLRNHSSRPLRALASPAALAACAEYTQAWRHSLSGQGQPSLLLQR